MERMAWDGGTSEAGGLSERHASDWGRLVLGEQCESHPDPHCAHSPIQETRWGLWDSPPMLFPFFRSTLAPPIVCSHCHATAMPLAELLAKPPTKHPGWPAAYHTNNHTHRFSCNCTCFRQRSIHRDHRVGQYLSLH